MTGTREPCHYACSPALHPLLCPLLNLPTSFSLRALSCALARAGYSASDVAGECVAQSQAGVCARTAGRGLCAADADPPVCAKAWAHLYADWTRQCVRRPAGGPDFTQRRGRPDALNCTALHCTALRVHPDACASHRADSALDWTAHCCTTACCAKRHPHLPIPLGPVPLGRTTACWASSHPDFRAPFAT